MSPQLEAEEALAEADGEGLHAHAAELGDGEVAELMHQDHDAEDDKKVEGDQQEVQQVSEMHGRQWVLFNLKTVFCLFFLYRVLLIFLYKTCGESAGVGVGL